MEEARKALPPYFHDFLKINLKTAFTKAPVLAYYDYTKKIVVETDASNWALGKVLY